MGRLPSQTLKASLNSHQESLAGGPIIGVHFRLTVLVPNYLTLYIQLRLDSLAHHPYSNFALAGHASQNPGSPKYFVPGYGDRVPGVGASAGNSWRWNPGGYSDYYSFGRRNAGLYNDADHRFWSNTYGGPWYHAGWTANTRTRWPSYRHSASCSQPASG